MKCVVITKTFSGKVIALTQEQTFPLNAFKLFVSVGVLKILILEWPMI
jgi:hypothetical protein